MGRPLEGWHLRPRGARKVQYVYFTHKGQFVQRTTGTSDLERASKVAADIYSAITTGKEAPRADRSVSSSEGTKLQTVATEWLNRQKSRLDYRTVNTYALYIDAHLTMFFETVENVTKETIEEYTRTRLQSVRAQTVKHERSVLRQVMVYAHKQGHTSELVDVPRFDTKTFGRGKSVGMRKRSSAPEVSPEEAEEIITLLPERSRGKWPVQARFIVAYETSLRPCFLDILSVPTHYTKGSKSLWIPDDDDKIGNGRSVRLSKRARQALDAIVPEKGIIFGAHDYRPHLRRAAVKVLGEGHRSKIFNGAHFRSCRITHDLEATGNLPGVQWAAGHLRTETTARYVKASERAHLAVLQARGAL